MPRRARTNANDDSIGTPLALLRYVRMTPEMFYPIGAFVLLAALGFGIFANMKRDKRKDAITEAATREEYQHPERFQRTQKEFEKAAEDIDAESENR